MNLTSFVSLNGNKVNGKKLTQPQLNLLAKLDKMGVTISDSLPVVVTNPVNGFSDTLDPFTATLVNWVYRVYSTYHFGPMNYRGHTVAIGVFDRVKYLVLSISPEAYRNFID